MQFEYKCVIYYRTTYHNGHLPSHTYNAYCTQYTYNQNFRKNVFYKEKT